MKNRTLSSLALPIILASVGMGIPASTAHAESQGDTLVADGIAGFRDKKGRGPVLSVNATAPSGNEENAKIVADAVVNQKEMKAYPIKFEFYVNRQLVSTQLRSPELPGTVAYEVPPSVAKTPFNYAVVATMLYPNRSFSSAVYGALFASNVANSLTSCTLTLANPSTDGSSASQTYKADTITVTQKSNEAFAVSFTTSTLQDGSTADTVEADASFTLNGKKVSGSLLATRDEVKERFQLSGDATLKDSAIDSFDVKSDDEATRLVCQ